MTARIAMWSGPRNISTTMMRAFENRHDCIVVDEPFYGAYLRRSGAYHPNRAETLAAQPGDFADARARLERPLPEGRRVLFAKHIAYHYPDDEPLDWISGWRSFILIRDPALMVASYARKYEDVAPIRDSFRVCRRVLEACEAAGPPAPVVDAADILADPPAMLRALCAALDIPFTERMLAWPAGPRASDGPWAPHWYDAVNASTGFRAPPDKPAALSDELAAIAAACAPDYAFFRARRLAPL
jgi:hypothetical protein